MADTARLERYANITGRGVRIKRALLMMHWQALVAGAVVSVLFIAGIVIWNVQNQPYSPLYGYGASTAHTFEPVGLPTKTVQTSTTGTMTVPVFTVMSGQEILQVSGQKCSRANYVIFSKVDKEWISHQPPGWIVPAPTPKLVKRPPGCGISNISNEIPTGVLAHLKDLARKGQRISSWSLQATETPQEPHVGHAAFWQSLTFAIDYEGSV